MNNDQRESQRKLRILEYAARSGNVNKTCRYFGIARSSFYRWREAFLSQGEAGLVNAKPIPGSHPNQTPDDVVEKVLHLRRKYHLGPIRIVWYLARYHGINISDAGVYRILKRNGLNRLPRGTRLRKVHTKRYNKQVPGSSDWVAEDAHITVAAFVRNGALEVFAHPERIIENPSEVADVA